MPHFEKSDMLDELKLILLHQADHIAFAKSPGAAEQFIGHKPTTDRLFSNDPISTVDLTKFEITKNFDEAYEYAYRPSAIGILDEGDWMKAAAFMQGIVRYPSQDLDMEWLGRFSEILPFMTSDGLCQQTIEMATARLKLDIFTTKPFSLREVALLAGMSEGAVRNAVSQKGEGSLSAIPQSKPVRIDHDEAQKWLMGRRGFIGTPASPKDDVHLHNRLAIFRTTSELSELIRACVLLETEGSRHDALGNIADRSGMSINEAEAWTNGSFKFDAGKAVSLASVLKLDEALFAGKALEISIRRDSMAGDGR